MSKMIEEKAIIPKPNPILDFFSLIGESVEPIMPPIVQIEFEMRGGDVIHAIYFNGMIYLPLIDGFTALDELKPQTNHNSPNSH
jgi:hypothetical protein